MHVYMLVSFARYVTIHVREVDYMKTKTILLVKKKTKQKKTSVVNFHCSAVPFNYYATLLINV